MIDWLEKLDMAQASFFVQIGTGLFAYFGLTGERVGFIGFMAYCIIASVCVVIGYILSEMYFGDVGYQFFIGAGSVVIGIPVVTTFISILQNLRKNPKDIFRLRK